MGQDTNQVTPSIGAHEQPPEPQTVDEAKARIEQTRDELSTTIDAIQEKLDPKRLRREAESRVQELTIGKVNQVRQSAVETVQHVVDVAGEKVGQVAERAAPVLAQAGQVTQQATATASQVGRQASASVTPLIQQASQQAAAAGIASSAVTERARTSAETVRATLQRPPSTWLEGIRRNPLPFAVAGVTLLGVVIAAIIGRGRSDEGAEISAAEPDVVIVATPPDPVVPIA